MEEVKEKTVFEIVRPEGELDHATELLISQENDHLVKKWEESNEPVVYSPSLVTRSQWGAAPPKYREPLCTPALNVLILDTKSDFCTCEETCSMVLKQLQHHYMEEKGLPDIPWNFMIGEDGRVYEGRGWVTNPSKTLPETEKYECRSLDIAYIGNYQAKIPSGIMSKALDRLISIGEGKCAIDADHVRKSELLNDFVEEPEEGLQTQPAHTQTNT